MEIMQGNKHYHRFIIGILIATLCLTVSANYADYPTECPKVDPMNYTILLPHETDCEKFYACYHGKKILMLCPLMDLEGNRLHFNPTLHVCDYPDNAGCESPSTTTEESIVTTENSPSKLPTSTSTSPSSTTTTTTTTTTEQPTSSTEGSTDEAPMTTTELPPVSTVVSTNHPSTTIIISSTTEQSTLYTGSRPSEPPITSITERPTSLTGSSSSASSITSTSEQPTSSTEVNTNEPSTTTIGTPTDSTPLSSSPTSDITNKYTEAIPTTSEWPLTSSATFLSTASDTIDTTNDQIDTTTASNIVPMCTQNTTKVFFPHESHPNIFYECTHGELIRRECDKNLVFDVTQQGCVRPSNTNYILKLFNSPQIFDGAILSNAVSLCNSDNSNSSCERHPHECDCTKYYICSNGNAVLRVCPSRLNFNTKLKECDLPGNVDCGGGDINSNNTIPTQCPPHNSGWAIHIAHETNCSLFYKCNWGKKIELPCWPGLYFNPILQVCDYPCAAGCTAEGGDGTNTCHTHIQPSSETTIIKQNPMLNVNMSENSISVDDQ